MRRGNKERGSIVHGSFAEHTYAHIQYTHIIYIYKHASDYTRQNRGNIATGTTKGWMFADRMSSTRCVYFTRSSRKQCSGRTDRTRKERTNGKSEKDHKALRSLWDLCQKYFSKRIKCIYHHIRSHNYASRTI